MCRHYAGPFSGLGTICGEAEDDAVKSTLDSVERDCVAVDEKREDNHVLSGSVDQLARHKAPVAEGQRKCHVSFHSDSPPLKCVVCQTRAFGGMYFLKGRPGWNCYFSISIGKCRRGK